MKIMRLTYYVIKTGSGRFMAIEHQDSCGGDHFDAAEFDGVNPITHGTRSEAVLAAIRCHREARGKGVGTVDLVLDREPFTLVGQDL